MDGRDDQRVPLSYEDMREGLRLEREVAAANDLAHVAQNSLNRFVGQLGAVYGVPDGWTLVDWLRGFEPPEAGPAAERMLDMMNGNGVHDG